MSIYPPDSSPEKGDIITAAEGEPSRGDFQSSAASQTSADTKLNDEKSGAKPEGVDVAGAEKAFEELSRQLTRASTARSDRDPETEDDEFDLRSYLRGAAEARNQHGFKNKRLGVVFEHLEVIGAGGIKLHIRTFPDAVKEFILMPVIQVMMRLPQFKPKPRSILKDFTGFAKPGEMVLVLGRPGSGCSTFLKAIANQRQGFLGINGLVQYGGINATEFSRYRGEVVYSQEDDVHHPTLTVAQTLRLALSTKTPGKRLPAETTKIFREEVMALLLKMLNIEHTRDTLVGNAQVRGVSGGERKRVSIAEVMASRACVASWDNSTRGLDASTALDYAKSLRVMTDIFKMTTFVSLYQAGEGIYDCFDKVLLINEGRQVYFGPVREARQYMMSLGFRNLPRQTSADYLSGCTDENERQFADDVDPETVPTSPEAMAEAYLASDMYKRMNQEREEYKAHVAVDAAAQEEFLAAVKEQKRKGVSRRSPYTVPFYRQVWALAIRQTQLRIQDRISFYFSWITSITVAIIVGTVYLDLPPTVAGAFTRGGVLFTALLFNAFSAFNELPTQMMGRPILWKQTSFAFFRPGALTLAGTLSDMPFTLANTTVFCIIIYFMTGLVRNGGAFFTFLAIASGSLMALASFFRLLGSISTNYDMAARIASTLVTVLVLYSGYMIPIFSMKRWLFWITYINPVNYAFEGLMGNEFGRIDLQCVGAYIVPNGPSYPQTLGSNQVCIIRGAEPGNPLVNGEAYISANYRYDKGNIWRNFGILIAFFILFLALQFLATEYLDLGQGMPAINVFQKENEERKKLNERLQARKKDFRSGKAKQELEGLIQTKKSFTWENLCYSVPVAGGQKQLLDNVFGYVKPGSLVALMGASGAGKTTLLDVLAQRKTTGVITGDMLIGGHAPGRDFQRGTAYCEQLDVHDWTSTVREALRFSAYLRQDRNVPQAEKDAYVEEIIQLLELEDMADAMIGFPGFGLGVEARKRVTIGVELAAKPQLLLFLDEPTSGLDGQSAFAIVKFLRKLASAGQAILCTIHQPNALLFENFDRLLLLKRGGRTVYFGDIGEDSHVIRGYFERNGALCPPNANPAEFMLEAIGAGSTRRIGDKDWADLWLESPEHQENMREIQRIKEAGLAHRDDGPVAPEYEFAATFTVQLKTVLYRANMALWRAPDYQLTKSFNHFVIALLTGLTFLNVGNGTVDVQYRIFVIFIASVLPALIIAQIEPSFIMARDIFVRESSSKMYSKVVFGLCQFLAEMPYSVLCAVLYFIGYYYPAGFNNSSDRAGYAFFLVLITEIYSVTLGQAVASLSPSILVAALCNPFLLVLFSLFCGVTVPKPSLPGFWREWMYNLDPFTRLIGGLVVNELHALPIICRANEFAVFQPPSGQTCEAWAGPFVNSSGGYLDNPSATSDCRYCTYRTGDDYYKPLGLKFENRWRDLGIMIAFTVFNFVTMITGTQFLTLRYAKR